jgi:hypothetical protein
MDYELVGLQHCFSVGVTVRLWLDNFAWEHLP